MNERCDTCGWEFTDRQWEHAIAEGFACPLPFESEPSSPRRRWSWTEACLSHASASAPSEERIALGTLSPGDTPYD